jgi:RNA polymerase sigma-70 factor (ECF subfamily)
VDVEIEEQLIAIESEAGGEPVDLERAIALLPAGCRAVFILHDIEGFTHQEIASQLGYSDGTSKSQLFRARRALRQYLSGTGLEETRNARP